jgi:murein DD-endopeptidase MepM/ murein hydrolase activator NlpD
MQKKYLFCFLLFQYSTTIFSQNIYPQNYFASPLPIPLHLNGNFGEIRTNHFHSGLDLKTDGHEGINVCASADGYISRVKISTTGFGKAIYIAHPNGYVTVYGHLYSFKIKIDSIVKVEQYKQKEFEVEIFPLPNSIPVKKGEIIALSGNSGGSEGPHLHFEIRDEKTEMPINPLLFGIEVRDTIAPILKTITIYPFEGTVNGKTEKQKFNTYIDNSGNYFLKGKIKCNGKIAIGFEATDKSENDSVLLGIYKVRLRVNNQLVYSYSFDKFSFDKTKYVNAHIDFAEKIDSSHIIERCYLLPGNNFTIYDSVANRGYINIVPGKKQFISLQISDFSANTSLLNFKIAGIKNKKSTTQTPSGNFFIWNKKNKFESNGIKLELPENSLYENYYFKYKREKANHGLLSDIYSIGDENTPLQYSYTLTIETSYLNDSLKQKAILVQLLKNDTLAVGGSILNNWLNTKVNRFGKFAIMLDTIAPTIENIELVNDTICNCKKIVTTVNDNLSGISKYNSWINNNWSITEYDIKKSQLINFLPALLKEKFFQFKVEVADRKGNINSLEKTISY